MELHLLDRSSLENQSFTVSHNVLPHFLKVWHYHPELELVTILKSSGTHFIGDNIERFDVGDVVLIGKNLPHMWLNDQRYFSENRASNAEAIAVHFKRDFLGESFLLVPENKKILRLLDKADNGIKFINLEPSILQEIAKLLTCRPFERMILFLQILEKLASHKNIQLLSKPSFFTKFHKTDNKRQDKIYGFVYNNFKNPINSKDVAKFIGMNPSSFSRYFKRIHGKTFTTYLNEIRIGYACKMLLENDVNITAIGFECGFNNLSNFNRQFKVITKYTPTQYIQLHTQ